MTNVIPVRFEQAPAVRISRESNAQVFSFAAYRAARLVDSDDLFAVACAIGDSGEEAGCQFIVGQDQGGLVGAAMAWPTELDSCDFSRVKANARLIASAPDLRAALVNLMTLVSPMVHGNKEFSVTWRKYEREARAAIAKAEGRDE